MRIALISDEFLPEGTRAHSKMIYELACKFKDLGNVPIVITPGKPNQDKILLIDRMDDIQVWRFRSGYTRGMGMFRRAINEFLLSFRAWFAIKKMVKADKIDLCVVYSPTIFFGPLAWKLRKQGAYVYLVLRDIFPQWAIDHGLIKKNSIITYFFKLFEKINYMAAHSIGLQSKANLDFFSLMFPKFKNIEVLMNWTVTEYVSQDKDDGTFRESLGISNKVLFFFGGNIGYAQDMSNIMRLAKNLKNTRQAHFLILGEGDECDLIKDLKTKWLLDNVTILPPVSQKEYESILAATDIGLISLAREHSTHNFPGKVLGYLKAAKPVLGSVNAGNDLLHVINDSNSGFVFINGEDNLLLSTSKRLIESAELRKNIGKNGVKLLKQKFSVDMAAKIILLSMNRL
ncbi:glycosyltransferase family 4 protein [Amylibacter sp.]|nr:glycosyltransferase family 4 protein [Amylibacter sp.]